MTARPWLAYVGAVATFWTLGCDADDPQRIAAFWALALGYVKESGFDGRTTRQSLIRMGGALPLVS